MKEIALPNSKGKRVWVISDTHTFHNQLKIPPNLDAVIHCGDESNSPHTIPNLIEFKQFIEWYDSLDAQVKLLIPGNHSVAIGCKQVAPGDYRSVTPVIDSTVNLFGYKLYGSPYTPTFGSDRWVYNCARNKLAAKWNKIPPTTQILVTHGPPKHIMDHTSCVTTGRMVSVGCNALRKRVKQLKLLLHCFGHIHNDGDYVNAGVFSPLEGKTTFINAACQQLRKTELTNGVLVTL